jgi:hypothetical protein
MGGFSQSKLLDGLDRWIDGWMNEWTDSGKRGVQWVNRYNKAGSIHFFSVHNCGSCQCVWCWMSKLQCHARVGVECKYSSLKSTQPSKKGSTHSVIKKSSVQYVVLRNGYAIFLL